MLLSIVLLTEFLYSQNTQEPIYLNFYETFSNYGLIHDNTTDCITFISDTLNEPPPGYFPQSFKYQIKLPTKIDTTSIQGIDCVSVKVNNNDSNCGGGTSSRRSEIFFSKLTNNGIGYYKLKFYIPSNFKINDPNLNGSDHHIFQIFTNQTIEGVQATPLPSFFIDFEHKENLTLPPTLSFNHGLEFRVQPPFNTCCGTTTCVNCSLNNGIADVANQYYCIPSSKEVIKTQGLYGWNEIEFKINWSDTSDGYFDIKLNGTNVNGSIFSQPHTFKGPNVYNQTMLPLLDGTFPANSHRYAVALKFGHYRYLFYPDNTPVVHPESTIYFEYFLADDEPYNIANNFETNIINDIEGVLDMREDILCKEVHNADEFIFLFEDLLTDPIDQQYIGNPTSTPHILTYDRLLNILDLEFYKNYTVRTRARFYDGFNGKYSYSKTIRLEPDTSLKSNLCGSIVALNEDLEVIKIKGADGYVLFVQEVGNPSNQFYHSIPSSGSISVQSLFNSHTMLDTGVEYAVNVRARFMQYEMEGNYSSSCNIEFVEPEPKSPTFFYPNPVNNKIYFSDISDFDTIVIMDFKGNVIKTIEDIENNEMDVSDLKEGIYFLSIKNGKESFNYKMIKSK